MCAIFKYSDAVCEEMFINEQNLWKESPVTIRGKTVTFLTQASLQDGGLSGFSVKRQAAVFEAGQGITRLHFYRFYNVIRNCFKDLMQH